MKLLTKEWINKAEKDYKVANIVFYTKDPIYDAACFHSQQCVEKYLKALLQENDIYFERIHDLDLLLEKCKSIIPNLYNFKKELVELTSFAVEVRYPGIESTKEDAEKSILIGKERLNIKKMVLFS